jgi:UTP:GlnB (protein PII) uridylyltransferase
MKHYWYMKHWMCSLPDVKIAADIDGSACGVILEIEALDTTQLLKVVSQVLPEHGVMAYADETQG